MTRVHVHAYRCCLARLHVCAHGHSAKHVKGLAVKARARAHAHALTFANALALALALALIVALQHDHLWCLAAANTAAAAAATLGHAACGCAQFPPQRRVSRLRCLRRRAAPRRRLEPRRARAARLVLVLVRPATHLGQLPQPQLRERLSV